MMVVVRLRILALVCLLLLAGAATAQYAPFNNPHQQFFDNNGHPLAGGRISTYAAGTLNPLQTYSDINGTPNTNPIVLDSGGFATIYLASGSIYKFVASSSTGIQQWTQDNVQGSVSSGGLNANFASPPPIGSVTPNTGQFTVLNKVINPVTYAGTDIGAKINAAIAANSCSATSPCHIVIPPSPALSFASTITLPSSTTLECTQSSYVDNKTVANQTLNYTGSGVALQIAGNSSNVIGCDIALGSSATGGILIGSASASTYSNHVTNTTVYGGGTSTILYHVGGVGATSYDTHLFHFRCSNFIGVCVQVDHAGDTFLEHGDAYGNYHNTTSTTLIVDSGTGGLQITDFSGGSSGLHGLIVRNTMGGPQPQWMFFKTFVTDISSDDGWVFDSSLGNGVVGFTAVDSWANTLPTGGSCVQINGGSELHFSGNNRFRGCGKSGININSASIGIQIIGNMIQANNSSNSGYSGIDISGHPNNVQINDNFVSVYPESAGFQQYFLHTTSDVEALTVVGNDCSYNVVGCSLTSSVTTSKLVFFGQSNQSAAVPSSLPGALTIYGLSTFYGGIQMQNNAGITATPGAALNLFPGAGATSDLAVKNAAQTINNLQVVDDGSIYVIGPLKFNGVTAIDGSTNGFFASVKIGGTNTAPVVATPTVGQAACIYAAGPPVQIGKCTSVVSSAGACTCAP